MHEPTARVTNTLDLPKIEHPSAATKRTGPRATGRATTSPSKVSTQRHEGPEMPVSGPFFFVSGDQILLTVRQDGQLPDRAG